MCVVLLAKYPVRGQSKTRLIPVVGEEGAQRVARAMLSDILQVRSVRRTSQEPRLTDLMLLPCVRSALGAIAPCRACVRSSCSRLRRKTRICVRLPKSWA